MYGKNAQRSPYVKLQDLKPGDKFYGWDGIVNVLIECTADPLKPGTLSYDARRMTSNDIYTRTFYGPGIQEITFLPYKGRHKNSFLAGFNFAMKLCLEVMIPQQKQVLGVQAHWDIHTKSLDSYDLWKENIKEKI